MSISPTPNTPKQMQARSLSDIKIATPDLIIANATTQPVDLMTELIFEDIGGQEIVDVARHDTLNGQRLGYTPIKRLEVIDFQYSPNNIIGLSPNSSSFFLNFPIKFENHLPSFSEESEEVVYFDTIQNSIIISLVNVRPTEVVQVQVLSSGELIDGTIYPDSSEYDYDEYS